MQNALVCGSSDNAVTREADRASSAAGPEADTRTPKPSADGWPSVTETKLSWVGFTNWANRCKEADPKLEEKLSAWAKDNFAEQEKATACTWKDPAGMTSDLINQLDPYKHYPKGRVGSPCGCLNSKRLAIRTGN
jgi:hypothetical protein